MHFDLCPKHAGPGEGGCPLCAFDSYESTIKAMTETAAEQSRVHVEMHGDLVVQDELILKTGGEAKRYRAALELIASTCQDLAAKTTACMALGTNNPD